jgi:AhpD family alkylhydroperoxidase
MSKTAALTETQQELIAVGVSIAAGCKPCTAYHLKAARAAGASDEEIRQAVAHALEMRRSATEIMARLADKLLGSAPEIGASSPAEKSLTDVLISAGAAFAVNCGTNLESHLNAARQMGATDYQMQITLTIARAVKNMADQKVEAAAAKVAPEGACCAVDGKRQHDGDQQQAQGSPACSCSGPERSAATC